MLDINALKSFFREFGSYFVLVYETLKNTGVVHNTAGTASQNVALTGVAGVVAALEHWKSKKA